MLKNKFLTIFCNILIILGIIIYFSYTLNTKNTYTCEQEKSEKELNELLKEKNIPDNFIKNMSVNLKNDIIKNVGDFKGGTIASKQKQLKKDIPNKYFDLYINVFNEPNFDGKIRECIYVYYKWKEHKIPLIRSTDCLGISWSDDWSAVPDSWYRVNEIYYEDDSKKINKCNTIEDIGSIGVAWDINFKNLSSHSMKHKKNITGYVKIIIEQNKKGTNKIYAIYAHDCGINSNCQLSFEPSNIKVNDTVSAKALLLNLDK